MKKKNLLYNSDQQGVNNARNRRTKLFGSTLASSPSNFTYTSEFTFPGSYMRGNGTNALWNASASFASFDYLSSQERQEIEVFFTLATTTSNFRVVKYNTNSWAKAGSVCEIDIENLLIKIYESYAYPSTPSSTLVSEAITVPMNTSDSYKVSFIKDRLIAKVVLTNITTGKAQIVRYDQTGTGFACGVFRGQAGIMHVKGDIHYSELNFYALNPQNPKIAIYGDSYVDGYSLDTNLYDRWTYRAYNNENGDALVSGWGGNSSADLITRLKDYQGIIPRNVIISVGYNDSNFATWLFNLKTIIGFFENKSCNVILTTYAPLSTTNAGIAGNITTMNTWILQSGFPYLDIGAIMTVGGDRVTINSSLLLADATHPNLTAHGLIFTAYQALTLYDYYRVDLLRGLVSYYKFDSNANDSKSITNGTLTGSPSATAAKIGNAYALNGTSQYITLADNNTLSFGNSGVEFPVSVSCWFKTNSLADTNYIISKRNSTPVLEYQLSVTTTGQVGLILFSAGGSTITIARSTPSSTITTGSFFHIVATYDASKTAAGINIYVNGVLQTMSDTSVSSPYAGMNNTAANVTIGGFGTTSGLNGQVDELAIYFGRVLQQSAVNALNNGGAGITYPF